VPAGSTALARGHDPNEPRDEPRIEPVTERSWRQDLRLDVAAAAVTVALLLPSELTAIPALLTHRAGGGARGLVAPLF
jgi:hypothetical protein